ncbi:glucose-6-phosphate dehydrogenase [Jatrophihabitans endophyticus]|uniref:glucose-6-phosphate dehydrogenase n=1 Tax=Jatrophihabitans endophyticus TaxID=1206085 RepID=UPI001A08B8F8|nr:glucose-6-phosphate dehydrogenase [Jatrophihabitans endophyticus]MBE7187526.1 glucose-6-phosphate dehydrogenase [Jatrophihabitans endophyticus]
MTSSARPGPTVFVLFGATGDLAKRMVLPAFYRLAKENLLPAKWMLVGNGRGDVSHYDFQQHVREVLTENGETLQDGAWGDFQSRLRFAGGGFEKADPGSLLDVIAEARKETGDEAQLVHYLAIPPSAFERITEGLGEHGLAKGSRVVYEKPFGTSPDGFRELDELVHKVLDEKQVYRIDHFLGKEATQNLHVLRFANVMFDTIWCNKTIRQVQIDVPETLGIADRAGFYDETGAVLDMLVTHLFQVAAEIAMEAPASLSADDLQSAREEVIGCFRPIDPKEVVLGQFDGYTDTEGIKKTSTTDTYVAAKLWVDNDRWDGVPFLLRTGKRLHASHQRVSLILRDPEGPLSDEVPDNGNVLSFELSGNGEISIEMVAKKPGAALRLETATAVLPLSQMKDADPLPPYVRLIHDVLVGDRSLFTRPDGLAAVWKAAGPLLDNPPKPKPYAPSSWGPEAARELAEPDGWLLGQ